MPDEGLGQAAATIIVRYIFTDEGEDENQLPHRCRPSRFAASDVLPAPFSSNCEATWHVLPSLNEVPCCVPIRSCLSGHILERKEETD